MNYRKQRYSLAAILLLLLIMIKLYPFHLPAALRPAGSWPVEGKNPYWLKVAVIPLDSRPPCTQFIEELGQLAGIKIIMPPPEMLDEYKTPARQEPLRRWLWQHAAEADAAIISADMLIHGGLLASRLAAGTPQDVQETLDLLEDLHQEQPQLRLYVYSIIPRLLIADSRENALYQRNMLKYSVLLDQASAFGNSADRKKLEALEKQLPAKVIQNYQEMYERNTALNITLLDMAEQGIITGLVLGQDDGQPFGLPNLNKQLLQHELARRPSLQDRVFITRGTDEVGLTLLGHAAVRLGSSTVPKVFVMYSTLAGADITMPYMPGTVANTVAEKLAIAGATAVESPSQADFILYVHVGTKDGKAALRPAARQVQDLLAAGQRVALVDLSENFRLQETLLPVLQEQDADILQLIAYAGWNTTSNSIGTAVTQAVLATSAAPWLQPAAEALPRYKKNMEFTVARFLDDVYFQKDVNPQLNKQLARQRIDPYKLDGQYYQTNYAVQKLMYSHARRLEDDIRRKPVLLPAAEGPQLVGVRSLTIALHLPWQRTFEIFLKPSLALEVLPQ